MARARRRHVAERRPANDRPMSPAAKKRAIADLKALLRKNGAWVRLCSENVYAGKLRSKIHGCSGVYAVRDRTTKTVVYVGESHTGRAWKTMLRHFQDPSGKFEAMGEWVHKRPEIVDILWKRTTDDQAMPLEKVWIDYFQPIGNIAGFEDDEASEKIPF